MFYELIWTEILANNGALVGGQRVGVDGGIGAGREGVEMGSQVQFGNEPSPMHPAGQFGSFLDNMKNFFSFLGKSCFLLSRSRHQSSLCPLRIEQNVQWMTGLWTADVTCDSWLFEGNGMPMPQQPPPSPPFSLGITTPPPTLVGTEGSERGGGRHKREFRNVFLS